MAEGKAIAFLAAKQVTTAISTRVGSIKLVTNITVKEGVDIPADTFMRLVGTCCYSQRLPIISSYKISRGMEFMRPANPPLRRLLC